AAGINASLFQNGAEFYCNCCCFVKHPRDFERDFYKDKEYTRGMRLGRTKFYINPHWSYTAR
ncbi:hypothetical protein, partial [uncultured Citrobacter sp.]|uniref:hypothetical protein n=1 Tax=uncultured Citrobacter sp. TaxID=200446 RepID=UPI00259998EC